VSVSPTTKNSSSFDRYVAKLILSVCQSTSYQFGFNIMKSELLRAQLSRARLRHGVQPQ
jgi:hypothetical protein